jgi:streptomycin 6-kinase
MSDKPLPEEFVQLVRDVWGTKGQAWLARFAGERQEICERWGLTLGEPFALSYNYVTRAIRNTNGQPVVLKMGVPSDEFRCEVASLEYYGGRGCVSALQTDYKRCAVLLPHIFPGEMLKPLSFQNDDKATEIAASIMRQLHAVPVQSGLHSWPTVADWGRDLVNPVHPSPHIPSDVRDHAAKLYVELCESSGPAVLLHGDLHHENILLGPNGYIAIDAKGVWGEPEYEAGALLRNPGPDIARAPDLKAVLARRLDILADETGYDRQRMKDWAFAQAVQSVVWSCEEAENAEAANHLTEWAESALTCAYALR